MSSIALTPKLIASAEPPIDRRYHILWDDRITGLGLQITKNNVRTSVLNYRVRSTAQQRQLTLGRLAVFDLAAARTRAKALLRNIAARADPAGDIGEQRAAPTVADLLDRYEQEHLPRKRELKPA